MYRSTFPIFPIVITFFALWFNREHLFEVLKEQKKILFLSAIITFFLSTLFVIRWDIELYGMWDSWANWSLKSKSITYEYINNGKVSLPVMASIHPEYPIGLPIFVTLIGIMLSDWLIEILYFISILCTFFIVFSFLDRIKQKTLALIGLALLYSNLKFFQISTDLCAELPLSLILLISISSAHSIKPKKLLDVFLLGICISLPIIIKTEGILFFIITFLYAVFILLHKTRNLQIIKSVLSLVVGTTLPFLFILFTPKLSNGFGNVDFKFAILLEPAELSNALTTRIPSIITYSYQFHFKQMYGLFLVSMISLFISKKLRLVGIGFSLLILISGYNIIYVFSIQDITWHLATSYARINIVLLPVSIYALLLSYRVFLRRVVFFIRNINSQIGK
ncbi:hypothetical protein [Leptospira vanthielii]|nr:hypothetical protein [Leptospira vanthielii]